ncbi:hypothetical protein BH10ACI1_BH10ACI1_21200 [soil metagenome]
MRLLSFLLCFALSLAIWSLVKTESKSEPKSVSVSSTPAPKITFFPFPKIEETKQITEKKPYLEYSGDTTITYNGYKIRNLENGLSISKKGKRLVFIPSAGIPFGNFGLKSLLGGNKKQLIYETYTGGTHGCIEQSIIDLSSSTPRIIFRSRNYDVSGVDNYDTLGTFDKENDGISEITQEFTYGLGMDCAEVSNPHIYIGFKYNQSAKKYLPMKKFPPNSKEWVEELKEEIEKHNLSIRNNKRPAEAGTCEYHSSIFAIALNYIYTGKEKEGLDYLEKNYLVFDYEKDFVRFNPKKSKEYAKKLRTEVKKYLSQDKSYKAIYNR